MLERVDGGIGERVPDQAPRQWGPGATPRREGHTPLDEAYAEEENGLAEKERREEPRGGVDPCKERDVIGQCGPRPVRDQKDADPAIVWPARCESQRHDYR
jgi:hypothetical protein